MVFVVLPATALFLVAALSLRGASPALLFGALAALYLSVGGVLWVIGGPLAAQFQVPPHLQHAGLYLLLVRWTSALLSGVTWAILAAATALCQPYAGVAGMKLLRWTASGLILSQTVSPFLQTAVLMGHQAEGAPFLSGYELLNVPVTFIGLISIMVLMFALPIIAFLAVLRRGQGRVATEPFKGTGHTADGERAAKATDGPARPAEPRLRLVALMFGLAALGAALTHNSSQITVSQSGGNGAPNETLYVIDNSNFPLALPLLFFALAMLYLWLGRTRTIRFPFWAGMTHAISLVAGFYLMFNPNRMFGLEHLARRYIDYPEAYDIWNRAAGFGALLVLASLCFFAVVMIRQFLFALPSPKTETQPVDLGIK
jgi:hypothetical protein